MTTVRDVMTTDYAWIGEDESVPDAAERLAKLNLPAVPVCSEDGELTGMLSSQDVTKLVEDKSTLSGSKVGDIDLDQATLSPDTALEQAIEKLSDLDLRRMPVVEGRTVVGVLTRADVESYSQLQNEFGQDAVHVVKEISPRDSMYQGTRGLYFLTGLSALRCIKIALLAAGKESVGSVLDFACGHGRVLRMLKAAFPKAGLVASDIDRDGVDFCAGAFGATPIYSEENPADMRFQERFDLIWCGSLLTHLEAERWRQFLPLFESLLEPNGLLVFSTHGRSSAERLRDRSWRVRLEESRVQSLLEAYDRAGFGYSESQYQSNYGLSLSSPAWVAGQLEALPALRLVAYTEKAWAGHQDVIACSRDL